MLHSPKGHILRARTWPLEYSRWVRFGHLEAGTHLSLVEVKSRGGAEVMVRWSTLGMGDTLFGHKNGSQEMLMVIFLPKCHQDHRESRLWVISRISCLVISLFAWKNTTYHEWMQCPGEGRPLRHPCEVHSTWNEILEQQTASNQYPVTFFCLFVYKETNLPVIQFNDSLSRVSSHLWTLKLRTRRKP